MRQSLDDLDRDQLAAAAGGQAQVSPRSGGDPLPPLGTLAQMPLPNQPGTQGNHGTSRCANPKEHEWYPLTIPFVGGPGITAPFSPCRKPKL